MTFARQPAGQSRFAAEVWPALKQVLWIIAIFAVTEVAALAHLGAVARLAFMGGALMLALHYWRRSPWLYLTLVFWFWTVTPLARRLIDYSTAFDSKNIVLVTPSMVSFLIILTLSKSRRLGTQPEAIGANCVIVAVLYGLAVSFLNGQIFAGAVGAMDWLAPVLYFFYILENTDRIGEAEPALRNFLIFNGIFITGYGLIQVWQPFAWDTAWGIASGMVTSDEVRDLSGFRPFSTLNENGVLAFWLGTLVILSLHFRNILSLMVIPAEALLLLMTNVRSVLASALFSIMVASLIGGPRVSRGMLTIGAGALVVAVSFGSLNPALVDRLAERYGSINHLQDDDSALTRAVIWRQTPQLIDDHPWGLGIGALGRGASLNNNADLVSVDFGALATYLSLGWVFGTVYLGGLFMTIGLAIWRAQRGKNPAAVACAAAALGMVLLMFVVNIVGLSGAIMWVFAGFAVAFSKVPVSNGVLAMAPGERLARKRSMLTPSGSRG